MTNETSGPLWTGLELMVAMHARAHGGLPEVVTGVSIDTRSLMPGDVFFAVAGEARDGHDFVKAALAKGAAAAVVDEAHAADMAQLGPLLVVDDVLAALVAAGRASRARSRARVIAVTGSVGKTSTKEALRQTLMGQGRTHASVASYNNHWGVPLTLARMPRETEFGIFEIGMSAPGEIASLVAMVQPDVAVVTTVAPVHLEFFPSVEAIADAKGEIFSGLAPGGTAIINRDSPHFERLKQHALASPAGRIVSFGEREDSDVKLVRAITKPDMSVVEADVMGTLVAYRLGTPGRHLVHNSLAVLAAIQAIGGDLCLAALRFADLAPPEGRGARSELAVQGGSFMLVDESYNANPASMQAALHALGQAAVTLRGRRIAVLGDMLELGAHAQKLHTELARDVVENDVQLVFAAGPQMLNLWHALPMERRAHYADEPGGLETHLASTIRAGDVVMVKGSNGTRISRLVAALKARFPSVHADEAIGA
ncbi:UDP-N-acetylmuramoylalanyl-D-glutamyl-2,6-diaminopimelate--D-alanyl-D-alanine ligase [Chelatococcus reniformis]|uniref:UDP-N-acetylmuramoyl-tripeptide--D-alanyl-D-alanine ligase n=1 Tax=Chelatococcus reniformis TaxID=1494448 RepID=A0A916UDM6_9HYPH|nr:UDP-N-acetylmuramoylalanyl-D-glutamyl-2,6-diaminopimelate--D-alanyl-D-alanine ligase [Chelatococcus reniformis]GGC67194.1 UDP-N-acetylmuramoyl-tripeptide--D-alanyl-D-alanine ligase [Chelatococcus reniformis]